MKILYIDMHPYGHNKRIHSDSIVFLEKYIDLVSVGRKIGGKNNYELNSPEELPRIISKESPDCILTYNPGEGNSRRLKPISNILKCISIPKFHISTDYGRYRLEKLEHDWFLECNYSAAFFRHKRSYNLDCPIPKYYLPFSIDEKDWNYTRKLNKDAKVGFIGAFKNNERCLSLYKKRISAANFFDENNIIDNFNSDNSNKLYGKNYSDFIGKNAYGLTCSGDCNFLVAKHFEIPASGGILISDGEAEGIEDFPDNSYIKYGGENMVEVLDCIKNFNSNKYVRRMFAEKLETYVYEKCTHHNRCMYLLNCIEKYI